MKTRNVAKGWDHSQCRSGETHALMEEEGNSQDGQKARGSMKHLVSNISSPLHLKLPSQNPSIRSLPDIPCLAVAMQN